MVKDFLKEEIENIIIRIWFKELGLRSKDLDKRRILKKFNLLSEDDIEDHLENVTSEIKDIVKNSIGYFHRLSKLLEPGREFLTIKSLEFPRRCIIVDKTGDKSECEFLYSSLDIHNSYVQLPSIQPQGRWFSLGDSWSQYLNSQGYIGAKKLDTDDNDREQGFEFYFNRDRYAMYEVVFERQNSKARIAKIDSLESARDFYEKYKKKKFGRHGCQFEDETVSDQEVVRVDYEQYKIPIIDWAKVTKDFAGIEFDLPIFWMIDKKFKAPRDELAWMLGIDIRSGCVWDDSIIQTFKKINLPVKGQIDKWHDIFETPIR